MEQMQSSQRFHQQEIAELQRTREHLAELAAVERRAHESATRQLFGVRLSHAKLQMQLDSQTDELERLRRACACSTASVDVSQQGDPQLWQAHESGNGAASGRDSKSSDVGAAAFATNQVTNKTLPMLRLAPPAGRQLLRDTTQRHCSSAEIRTVLDSAPQSRADAVKQLLVTNAPCGLCILERVSIPLPDILVAVQGCMHQEENRCDASTGLSRISSLIPLGSIHDRGFIVGLVEVVEAGACVAIAANALECTRRFRFL
jgi:hypothetical protein